MRRCPQFAANGVEEIVSLGPRHRRDFWAAAVFNNFLLPETATDRAFGRIVSACVERVRRQYDRLYRRNSSTTPSCDFALLNFRFSRIQVRQSCQYSA